MTFKSARQRKAVMARFRSKNHLTWKNRSKRSRMADLARPAKRRPAKTFRKGISNRGDW